MKNKLVILLIVAVVASSCSKRFTGLNFDFRDATSLKVNEFDFDYFQGKAKLNFKDKDYDVRAKANIRIRKDSVIWLNFSAVGISGGRCLINRDSLTLLNLIKKEYYVFTYDDLSEQFNYPISYDVLQAVIVGNFHKSIATNDTVSHVNDFYKVMQYDEPFLIESRVNAKTMKLESVNITEDKTNNNATVQYSNFVMVDEQAFAFRALVNLLYENEFGKFITNVDLEYSKAEIKDKELKFPFNIPNKYARK